MKTYVDYEFYEDIYKGNMPEDEVENISIKASMKIRERTFERADNTSGKSNEAVKLCTCFLIDKIKEYDELISNSKNQNNVKTESLGKWSKTFENKSVKDLEIELKDETEKIISEGLSNYEDDNGTPLLYRGCY